MDLKLMSLPLLYLLLGIALPCFSTCVVILRTDKRVTVGADSRRIFETNSFDASKRTRTTQDDMCKIRKAGNYYFAFAGFHDELQIKYATEICLSAHSIKEIMEEFPKKISNEYANAVERMRIQDINFYSNIFFNHRFAMVSIFGIENDKAELASFFFSEVNPPDLQAKISCNVKYNSPWTILGAGDLIIDMPKSEMDTIKRLMDTDPIQFITKQIEYTKKMEPYYINGPIDILELSVGEDPKWLQRKDNCKD